MLKISKARSWQPRSPTTVNIQFRVLRSAFNLAIKWGQLADNPFNKSSQVKAPEQTVEERTDTEILWICFSLKRTATTARLSVEGFQEICSDGRFKRQNTFHSLRHSFASWLVQDGVSIYEVQKLLGHSSVKVTEIYSHLVASELHKSVNKILFNLN